MKTEIYENSERQIPNPKTAANTIEEFSKQEIFHQIDSELMSQRTFDTYFAQTTKSNYKFIIWLDICALIIALIGGGIVYNIFREQSIELVAGQNAVRTLELTLLEQLDKQHQINLLNKELELSAIRESLEFAELELQKIQSQIKEEAQKELEKQKQILEEKIAREIKGKSAEEQKAIRAQYENERKKIEDEVEKNRIEKEKFHKEQFDKLQKEKADEKKALESQLRLVEQKAADSQKKLVEIIQIQPVQEPAPTKILVEAPSSLLSKRIAQSFIQIEEYLYQNKYSLIEKNLKNIEQLYKQAPQEEIIVDKQTADIFLVSLIREYIKISEKIVNLEIQISTNKSFTPNETSSQLKKLLEQLTELKNSMELNQTSSTEINKKVQSLNKQIPEIIEFVDAYTKYKKTFDSTQARPIIKKAEKNIARGKYKEAIEQYQSVLRLYPGIIEQDSVLTNLYEAIRLELQKQGNNILVNENPSDLQKKVQNLMKDSRYQTPQAKIIYMSSPLGYIADIIGTTAIISLTPGIMIKKNAVLSVFRISSEQNLSMNKLGTMKATQINQGNKLQLSNINSIFRIGDLIYPENL